MNKHYHFRLKQYSITTSQELGILKAQDLGINLNPKVYETGLWKNQNPMIQKISRFGDKYLDIFGDDSCSYLYSLENPFDAENFFTIKHNHENNSLSSDNDIDFLYGFKEAIGLVLLEVETKNQSFSNIKIHENSAVFYVGNDVFAEITQSKFSEVDINSVKECTTLLKGIHTGKEFIEKRNYQRLAKFPGLENYQGHQIEIDGEFINPTISNFVKGFKWLVESFTDDKVTLSDAEKIMWAFHGIDNEHLLRANEKNQSIIKLPYYVEVYGEKPNENHNSVINKYFYRSFTEALVGFRNKVNDLNIERPFIYEQRSFGSLISISDLPKSEELVGKTLLQLGSYSHTSEEVAKEYIDKANELFRGEIEFSQKEDKVIKRVNINNKVITVFRVNGKAHIEDKYQNMLPLNSLIIAPPEGVRVLDVETGEEKIRYGKDWHIMVSKYNKPTKIYAYDLGALNKEDISMLVKELQIPVFYCRLKLTLDEKTFYFKLNKRHCHGNN